MSLVETFPFPHPHQIVVKDGVVTPRVPVTFAPPPTLSRLTSLEERWAAQLAHLASQHQNSEYNRIKFGPQGCPMVYVPLSIQMPGYVKDLYNRQALCANQQAWWPCRDSSTEKMGEPLVLGPCGAPAQSTVNLQQEISAAIAAPLSSIPATPSPQSSFRQAVKTSDTHPINVSTIIPFELLPIISSHLALPRRPFPVMFEISPLYTIDRITAYSHTPPYSSPPSFSSSPIPDSRSQFVHIRNPSSISEALQAAINSGIAAAASGMVAPANGYPWTEHTFKKPMMERAYSMPTVASWDEVKNPNDESKGASRILHKTPVQPPVYVQPNVVSKPTSFTLGNLYLSSCPGKKVRLNGPVKGRSTVCRNLDTDLKRMKDLGVRCVVCCLDDEELEFLGASWSEYSRAAEEVGLDVLRIPIPEGFAPLTPLVLDTHLSKLIKTYTQKGIPILVHCRGGVGRAGLVACCWALKLGLCGWIETGASTPGVVRRDTLQLVERMIGTIRKRRSVKAIETFEQVKFLVDYVEFLRERPVEEEVFGSWRHGGSV